MNVLLEPFVFEFFRNAAIVATLAGGLCGLVGVYVVLRNMSYVGHGLSHAVFGGAVVSAILGVNFYLGAGLWGVAAAMLINTVARRRIVGADAAIGVVTTASFALGLAIISRRQSFSRNLDAALFGNVLGVTPGDVVVVAVVVVGVVAVVCLRYRSLLFATFDPDVADVSGVSTARMDTLFAVVLAASIIATMRVLGVMLIAATLVVPAVVARLVTSSFSRMLWLSTGIGAACGLAGLYLSYYLDISSGSAIVLLSAALFALVFVSTGRRRSRVDGLDRHDDLPAPVRA